MEATVETFAAVRDVRVELLRSDGTGTTPATLPVDPGALSWMRAGESSPATFGNVLTLASRDRVVARFEIQLDTPGVYELVMKAAGATASGPVRTEAMALLPVGAQPPRPVVSAGAAEFLAVPSLEVQP